MANDMKIIGYSISSSGFSHDLQVEDALNWMEAEEPAWYLRLVSDFPEIASIQWDGSWFDTEAMGVDGEWSSWLTDALEMTGFVYWEDGEPYATLEVDA